MADAREVFLISDELAEWVASRVAGRRLGTMLTTAEREQRRSPYPEDPDVAPDRQADGDA